MRVRAVVPHDRACVDALGAGASVLQRDVAGPRLELSFAHSPLPQRKDSDEMEQGDGQGGRECGGDSADRSDETPEERQGEERDRPGVREHSPPA